PIEAVAAASGAGGPIEHRAAANHHATRGDPVLVARKIIEHGVGPRAAGRGWWRQRKHGAEAVGASPRGGPEEHAAAAKRHALHGVSAGSIAVRDPARRASSETIDCL